MIPVPERPTMPVADLREHPRNAGIYGEADDGLAESVASKGVLQALVVTRAGVVIAGHRRLKAARKVGLERVPVDVFGSDDELDVLEALVHANKQRDKNKEQQAREAQTLMEVEKERAKRRQQESGLTYGRGKVVEHVPPPIANGKARDKVGEKLGVSGKTVENLVEIVDAIDRLTEAGEAEKAERVRKTLRGGSVRKASAAAKAALAPAAEPPPAPLTAAVKEFRAVKAALGKVRELMQKVAESRGGEALRKRMRRNGGSGEAARLTCQEIDDLSSMIHNEQPHASNCPGCDGKDASCPLCSGRGWLTRGVWKELPEKLKPLAIMVES